MFERFRPAVEQALQASAITPRTHFSQLVRDELSDVSLDIPQQSPEKQQLNQLYELRARVLDWELGTGYLGFFSANPGSRYTFTRRLEAVFDMLPDDLSGLQILEVGCGAGLLCLELAQKAQSVTGIDVSHVVLNFASQVQEIVRAANVTFQHGDAENLAFAHERFDLVICSEVLEHLLDPERALAEIQRVVKPGGTVVLTTPSAESLSDLCMGFLRLFSARIESEKDIQFDKKAYLALQRSQTEETCFPETTFMRIHERFSYAQLLAMFDQAGLHVEDAQGTIFAFPPHYQLFYRYCPGFLLPGIHALETALNAIGCFQRFGSVTSCFLLKKRHTPV